MWSTQKSGIDMGNERNFRESLKKDMMELWRDTFHDSQEYVSLIFDNYYEEGVKICRRSKDGEMISSMFGIPYLFLNNNTGESYSGLYLCGLATRPEFRGRGIMGSMIEEITSLAGNKFDFLFLIPADAHLREYYRKFGFEDSFVRTECLDNDKKRRKDNNDNKEETDSARIEYFDAFDQLMKNNGISVKSNFSEIIKFFENLQTKKKHITVQRSIRDFQIILEECFLGKGRVYINRGTAGVTGVGMTYLPSEQFPYGKLYFAEALSNDIKEEIEKKVILDFPNIDMNVKQGYYGMSKILSRGAERNLKIGNIRDVELNMMLD